MLVSCLGLYKQKASSRPMELLHPVSKWQMCKEKLALLIVLFVASSSSQAEEEKLAKENAALKQEVKQMQEKLIQLETKNGGYVGFAICPWNAPFEPVVYVWLWETIRFGIWSWIWFRWAGLPVLTSVEVIWLIARCPCKVLARPTNKSLNWSLHLQWSRFLCLLRVSTLLPSQQQQQSMLQNLLLTKSNQASRTLRKSQRKVCVL